MDETESIRREMVNEINSQVESNDPQAERTRLEKLYGQVWNTDELRDAFEVLAFSAPFVVVRRRADGVKGTLEFQHLPRFYFMFVKDEVRK